MTLEEAKNYINQGINEGFFSEEIFEHMTDEALIQFAEEQGAKGDAYIDSLGLDEGMI